MNNSKLLHLLKDLQIQSALIWAITIIACGWISDKTHVSTILITAAGFHVLLMTWANKKRMTENR